MRKLVAIVIGSAFALAACGLIVGSQPPTQNGRVTQKPPSPPSSTESGNRDSPKQLPQITEVCECSETRQDYEECLLNEFDKLQGKLDIEYNNTLELLKKDRSENDVRNLRSTQARWLAYRDSECQSEKDLYGMGTDAVAVARKCLIDLTDKRLKELGVVYGKK